jgi:hypothetical protein
MRWVPGLLLVAGLLAGLTAAVAVGADPASARYAAVLAAMQSQRSVHYVATERVGTTHVTYVGDIGATQGIQRVVFSARGRTGQVTEVVSNHRAWIRGDAFALSQFLAFPDSIATKYAGRWVNVPSSDYAGVAEDVTLGSAIDTLRLKAPIAAAPARRIGGRSVIGIRGRSSFGGVRTEDTLYARAAGLPLPVAEIGTGEAATNVTFSRWNEAVRVTVPTHAVTVTDRALPNGPAVPA